MKLAEALANRAELQRKLAHLKERILRNAKVQEGEKPAEDPNVLIQDFETVASQLRVLVVQINKTNSQTPFSETESIADVLARRDEIESKRSLLNEVAKSATVVQERYKALEVRFQAAVNVSATQRQADKLAKEFRELDIRIQQLNWATDLLN